MPPRSEPVAPAQRNHIGRPNDWLGDLSERALDLIAAEYTAPRLCPDVIASRLHVSRRHLYRAFESRAVSIAQAIADARTTAAIDLMASDPRLSRREVARRCGFSDVSTLARHLHTSIAVPAAAPGGRQCVPTLPRSVDDRCHPRTFSAGGDEQHSRLIG